MLKVILNILLMVSVHVIGASLDNLNADTVLQIIKGIKRYKDLMEFCKTNVFIRDVCITNAEVICMNFMLKTGYKERPGGYTWCRLMRMVGEVSPKNMHYTNKYTILSEAFKNLDMVEFSIFRHDFIKMHPKLRRDKNVRKKYKKEAYGGNGDITRLIRMTTTLPILVKTNAFYNAFRGWNVIVGGEILDIVRLDDNVMYDMDIVVTVKDLYVAMSGVDEEMKYFNFVVEVVGEERDVLVLMINSYAFMLRYFEREDKRAEQLDFIIYTLVERAYYYQLKYYYIAHDILLDFCVVGECDITSGTRELVEQHYMLYSDLSRSASTESTREIAVGLCSLLNEVLQIIM